MTTPAPTQLGVCSWSLNPDDIDDLCEKLARLPLQLVQLDLTAIREQPDAWQNVAAKLQDIGYTIASGMFRTLGEDYSTLQSIRRTGGVVPDEHWEANWKIVEDVAALADKLDLSLVSSHAGFMPEATDDPNYGVLVDRIRRISNRFADVGVTFLFETGQESAATLKRFIDALDAAGAAAVGVNFDPANMILYDMGDPVAALRDLMPRVKQVHLKDAVRTDTPGTWGTETPIGSGDVDWPAFFDVLRDAAFDGPLVIERESGDQRMEQIGAAIDHLVDVMTR